MNSNVNLSPLTLTLYLIKPSSTIPYSYLTVAFKNYINVDTDFLISDLLSHSIYNPVSTSALLKIVDPKYYYN